MPARSSAPFVAIVLVVAMRAAPAQTPADSAADSARVKLKAVTVTGARSAGIVGGASAVVVRTEELKSSPAPLLDQALREIPFVHVRQNSRGEMELSVRGSDSRQAAVLLDGVPLTLGWDHRTDPSLIPLTGTRSLVIVRGLGSLLNGPNTIGGTIEVGHAPVIGTEAWIGGGVDETGAVVTTLGGARALNGSLAVRGGMSYRKRDGVTLPSDATDPTADDGERTNSDLRHVDGNAGVYWNGASGRALSLNVSGFDAERGVPPEEHLESPRLWRYPYHSRAVIALSGSTGTFGTPFGTASLDIGGGYNSGRLKIETYGDRTYSNVTGEELGDERNLVGRARLTHSLGGGTVRAALTTSDIHYDETLSGNLAKYQQTLWSAGAEVEIPVRAGTVVAGGLVFDKSSTPETGGRTPKQEPIDNVGWRAGLSHELSSAWRLHASASQRSRFPALRELYSGSLNRFSPNPELEPETLLGFEAGLTMNRAMGSTGTAVVEVTGFQHNLDDAVVRITLPAPDNRFRRVNRDEIESSGAELLAGFTFGGVGDRAFSLTGDALLQKITIRDKTLAGQPERHSENNPETRGSLELGVPLPLQFRGAANARYTGKQYCLNADSGDEMTLDSQTETDLSLARTFSVGRGVLRTLRALVSLDNVGNATVYDQCGLPQPGRTVRVMFMLR